MSGAPMSRKSRRSSAGLSELDAIFASPIGGFELDDDLQEMLEPGSTQRKKAAKAEAEAEAAPVEEEAAAEEEEEEAEAAAAAKEEEEEELPYKMS